jgi:hypothetical protein
MDLLDGITIRLSVSIGARSSTRSREKRLTLLFLLTYSNSNDDAFYRVQHLRSAFLDIRQRDRDYTKVSISCTSRENQA